MNSSKYIAMAAQHHQAQLAKVGIYISTSDAVRQVEEQLEAANVSRDGKAIGVAAAEHIARIAQAGRRATDDHVTILTTPTRSAKVTPDH